jgi:glutamine synthetase
LEKDEVIRSAMPGKLHDLYQEYKRDEWTRFLREVTNWDVEQYLDCVP